MSRFKEIKITDFDASRPPRIRKEAYIDLFYQLSGEAPAEWCDDFESTGRHLNPPAKVDKFTRCFINTYVNDKEVIPGHLEQLKLAVFDCNTQYLEKIRQRAKDLEEDQQSLREQGGEQYRLNEIVESLRFDN